MAPKIFTTELLRVTRYSDKVVQDHLVSVICLTIARAALDLTNSDHGLQPCLEGGDRVFPLPMAASTSLLLFLTTSNFVSCIS